MQTNIQISIVIPTYNRSNYLLKIIFQGLYRFRSIAEYGGGDGSPVISALKNKDCDFRGIIRSWEINKVSAGLGQQEILKNGLSSNYILIDEPFPEERLPDAELVISNPPYIPSRRKSDLNLPELHGGVNGNEVSKKILAFGYDNVLLVVSSYSDPQGLISNALKLGFKVAAFLVNELPFGPYTKQNCVMSRIEEMKRQNKAFFNNESYFISGVLFSKEIKGPDRSNELLTRLKAANSLQLVA
jgi:hypothetical protein